MASNYSVDDTERGGRAAISRQFTGEEDRAWFRQIRERSPRACESVFLYAEDDEADETAGTGDAGNGVQEEIIVVPVSRNAAWGASAYAAVSLGLVFLP